MAAGDALFFLGPDSGMPPAANAATLDIVTGNVNGEDNSQIRVADFDASTIEHLDFSIILPQTYAGGGISFSIKWSASSAAVNETRWEIGIRRVADDAEDLDTTAHTYAYNEVDATAPSAIGEVAYDTISFTDGADMDSWAAGELAIVRVRRNASHGNDDMAGDAELHAINCLETP